MKKFNEERTFGIEIEFVNASREDVAAKMRAKGLNAAAEEYNHTVRRGWKVITDVSCGNELVSPILKGRDGINQLKLACEALAEAGAKVNRSCGLHIHHDINSHNAKQIANIIANYIKHEKAFDSILPNSRRGNNNEYCQTLKIFSNNNSADNILEKLNNIKTVEDISRIFRTRYVKLNFQSYVKYGTIEFRQHSGTIEFDKIYNWLLLTQQVVEAGLTPVRKSAYREDKDTLDQLRYRLNCQSANHASEELVNMFKFYKERKKALAA